MDIWDKIRSEYVRGGISHTELAAKYGVSYTAVKEHCRKEGWVAQRAEKRRKAAEKIVDRAAEREARQAEKLYSAADKLLDRVTEAAEIVSSTREIRELTAAAKDIKDLLSLKGARDVREQEARISKLIHDAQRDEQTAQEIRIVMDPALDELAQ